MGWFDTVSPAGELLLLPLFLVWNSTAKPCDLPCTPCCCLNLCPWLPHSLSSSHMLLLLLKILNLSSSEAPAVPGARSTLPISAQHYCLALPISISSLCCICHHLKFSGLGICFFSSIYPLHSFMRACSLSLGSCLPYTGPTPSVQWGSMRGWPPTQPLTLSKPLGRLRRCSASWTLKPITHGH